MPARPLVHRVDHPPRNDRGLGGRVHGRFAPLAIHRLRYLGKRGRLDRSGFLPNAARLSQPPGRRQHLFTEISDYAPYASIYHAHPFVAVAVGPWTAAPLPPWVAYYVFVGVSLGLLLLSGRLLASVFPDPTSKALCYFVMFFGLPVYGLLWNAQAHVFIVLAVVLILAALVRWEQDPASADRYLRWIQLGMLIALLSKPIVLLMLPVFLAVPEMRRKVILPVAVYAAVSLLFLLLPRLNPGGYNGVHWLFMFSGSLAGQADGLGLPFPGAHDYTDCPWVYSLPMLLYRTCGEKILPLRNCRWRRSL